MRYIFDTEGDKVHSVLFFLITTSMLSVGNTVTKQLVLNKLCKKLAFSNKWLYI